MGFSGNIDELRLYFTRNESSTVEYTKRESLKTEVKISPSVLKSYEFDIPDKSMVESLRVLVL
jgi:hypothetical protein